MRPSKRRKGVGPLLAAGLLAVAGCSTSANHFGDSDGGGGGGSGAPDGTTPATDAIVLRQKDAAGTCPSSCATLKASCGSVTDTVCGGVVQCGGCPTGKTCGGGGVHNVCGVGSGTCTAKTCAEQGVTCGQASDGCNGSLQCGTCTVPETCGGNPSAPGKCGCTGECASVVACDGGTPTTLTGKVYDPAGLRPLYNVLVYVPNDTNDPGLQPFTPGVTCSQCDVTAAGNPLVTTFTAPDGTFTLQNVPVGASVPLVIQLGHWRREFVVDASNACAANAVPDLTLKMPSVHTEGDIPYIGILTGNLDPIECVLRQIGIADSEFTDPSGAGHINLYLADDTGQPGGSGAVLDTGTPSQAALFATEGGTPAINKYDMVILECEGYPQTETAADQAALVAYTSAGGRVFASDYAYTWLNGPFVSVAAWDVDQDGSGFSTTGYVDLTSNPQAMAFDQWLVNVGVSVASSNDVTLDPVFHNTNGIFSPTQQWLYWNDGATKTPIQFTFNTPVGASSSQQCGRVVFNDWHAQTGITSYGTTFPDACPGGPMTPQEATLEFMLFDLAACVQPYTPVCSPGTCAAQGIQCGPASDGCGNLLACGTCPSGQTCGGGGPGKCGTGTSCSPESCASQGIECGEAGDGCDHIINCGNCPTGSICGLDGAGKCGAGGK